MSRVMITGARAPVALHLTRLFHAAGHEVVLADSQRFPISCATRFKSAYVRLPSPNLSLALYGKAVMQACRAHQIDLVIPTCEEVFYLAAARDHLRLDIPLFAAHIGDLRNVHNKADFAQKAAGFGTNPPTTHVLTQASDLEPFLGVEDQWVFKPVWSRFGERVLIRPERQKFTALQPTPDDPWVAQAYMPGEELCCYAVAYRGKLVAHQAYRPLYRAGAQTGAGVAVEPIDDKKITKFIKGFIKKFKWHGQISFDFRRDADGDLHVIECNPRATTGLHFFARNDGLADAILSGAAAAPSIAKPLSVPLAMLIYALPEAVRERKFGLWSKDFRRMGNLLRAPGDRGTGLQEALALIEIAATAVTTRQSLKAAATADIEWNGGYFL